MACLPTHQIQSNIDVDLTYLAPGATTSDFGVLAANTVWQIHKNHGPGDILVFLPGKSDIDELCRMVRKLGEDLYEGLDKGLDVFPLHSKLPAGERTQALASSGPNRKCIASTDIAENMTFDNVVYVVDAGFSKQMIFNPCLNMHMLQTLMVSKVTANQRTSRAGGSKDSHCYRLYSEDDYDGASLIVPAIRNSQAHSVVMTLLAFGERNIVGFDYLEAPSPEGVARAFQDLLHR